jgi:hypothetical protein
MSLLRFLYGLMILLVNIKNDCFCAEIFLFSNFATNHYMYTCVCVRARACARARGSIKNLCRQDTRLVSIVSKRYYRYV